MVAASRILSSIGAPLWAQGPGHPPRVWQRRRARPVRVCSGTGPSLRNHCRVTHMKLLAAPATANDGARMPSSGTAFCSCTDPHGGDTHANAIHGHTQSGGPKPANMSTTCTCSSPSPAALLDPANAPRTPPPPCDLPRTIGIPCAYTSCLYIYEQNQHARWQAWHRQPHALHLPTMTMRARTSHPHPAPVHGQWAAASAHDPLARLWASMFACLVPEAALAARHPAVTRGGCAISRGERLPTVKLTGAATG